MLQKILVPLDGSKLSDRILEQVRRLLLKQDAEVRFLRVLSEVGHPPGPPRRQAVEEAQAHLEGHRLAWASQGVKATMAVLSDGDPAERILEYADQYRPSLIAMSTHGRTGLKRWTRGSVAERVLRHSSFPVLLWNPFRPERRTAPRLRIGRILVPLDGSEHSAWVLPLVRQVARSFGARVLLLHVTELYPTAGDLPMVQPWPTPAEVERHLAPFRKILKGVEVRILGELGTPSVSILEAARREKADLIAMTTHGRSGISRWAFGSVAEQVLRHCHHPLLVQRAA